LREYHDRISGLADAARAARIETRGVSATADSQQGLPVTLATLEHVAEHGREALGRQTLSSG